MIYNWQQVNGVSVTDPSLSDLSDLLFLLMSAPLVSFFFFSSPCLVWAPLSICHLSLKRKKGTVPMFHSRCLTFCFPPPPFSHTHIPSLALASTSPSNLWHALVSGGAGWSITWFDGSYYRPGFPGQDAGIFIEADKGSSKTSHPLEAEDNLTQVWFIIIFLPFHRNVKYDLLPPPSCGERHSIVTANFKPSARLSGKKMNPFIWLIKGRHWSGAYR